MNKFFKSISSLHQQALLPLAGNLNESETLFILSQNLLATKWPSSFNFKKDSTKQEKKFSSPFVLEGIVLYLYRDRMDITPARHAAGHFVASYYGGC